MWKRNSKDVFECWSSFWCRSILCECLVKRHANHGFRPQKETLKIMSISYFRKCINWIRWEISHLTRQQSQIDIIHWTFLVVANFNEHYYYNSFCYSFKTKCVVSGAQYHLSSLVWIVIVPFFSIFVSFSCRLIVLTNFRMLLFQFRQC